MPVELPIQAWRHLMRLMIGTPFWTIQCFTPRARMVITIFPRQPWTCISMSRPHPLAPTPRTCLYPIPNCHNRRRPGCLSQLHTLMSRQIDPLPHCKRSAWRDLSVTSIAWWEVTAGIESLKAPLCGSYQSFWTLLRVCFLFAVSFSLPFIFHFLDFKKRFPKC